MRYIRQISQTAGDSDTVELESPSVRLCNRHVTMEVCLPDENDGYYRGTRFDWSGCIRDLRFNKHRYFDEWFTEYDPLRHDCICGPVDEFTEIGYDSAPMRGEFLKIGIGTLIKPSNEPYDRFKVYRIENSGERLFNIEKDRIDMRHLLISDEYGYDYHKTIRLYDDRPGFRIKYVLKNLGPKPLIGYVYNHNFFTIDGMTTGTNTEILFPFRPKGEWREQYDSVALTERGIGFSRNLQAGESVFMGNLHGQDPTKKGYSFELINNKSGAGVRAVGSGKLSNIVFWACPTTPCVEPYTSFRVFPGEAGVWSIDYELFEKK